MYIKPTKMIIVDQLWFVINHDFYAQVNRLSEMKAPLQFNFGIAATSKPTPKDRTQQPLAAH